MNESTESEVYAVTAEKYVRDRSWYVDLRLPVRKRTLTFGPFANEAEADDLIAEMRGLARESIQRTHD